MIIGVPREIKTEENRVALTPAGVGAFVAHGHTVIVEHDAGAGSRFPDVLYRQAGAQIANAAEVWSRADLVLKVKEPLASEYAHLRPGLVLFTYLHLAADPRLTRALRDRQVVALAYETLQLDDGALPLLAPMSEIAGRLAVQVGAWCLEAQNGGRGVLLSGASGVRPANVVIVGAGISGAAACQVAVGVGAHVSILDVNPARLRYVHDILGGHVTTVMSNRANIAEEVAAADLVIGAVLIPGRARPSSSVAIWSPPCGRARRWWTWPSTRAAAPKPPARRRTRIRSTRSKASFTTASPTCRPSFRTPRRRR